MKKVLSVLAITILTGSICAANGGETLRSLYDVIAPVIAGNPVAADRQVGQIYFDVTANRFKGINKDGGIDILTNVGGAPASIVKTSVHNASEDDLVFDPATGAGTATVIFRDETYDVGSLYSPTTGVFTATATGQYTFSASVRLLGTNYFAGDKVELSISINSLLSNGSNYTALEEVSGDKNNIYLNIAADLNLQAGDTVKLELSVSRIGSGPLKPTGFGGWASFKQIP